MVTSKFSKLRREQFARLDANRHVYLDYTGSGLYPQSLLDREQEHLSHNVYGNPHSINPTSKATTSGVDATRQRVLQFFNASPQQYIVIFTANATGAIKLVAESFPFRAGSTFALLMDNHNSVNGIREYAFQAHAAVRYLPLDSHLRAHGVHHLLSHHHNINVPNLFAYPAQSNFSGVQHSLSYIACAHSHGWSVLLDAAAYVPTSPLDLSKANPDFVAMSFYKMFGLPTGVGALIARRTALQKLNRPWFAGGTVDYVAVGNRVHVLSAGPEAFEDGTLNFLSILTISEGLDFLQSVGMDSIHDHVVELTVRLIGGFSKLYYSATERPMVRVYGPLTGRRRGGTISFDVLKPDGHRADPAKVEAAANERNISLRSGCFCNPGAAERALKRDYLKERACLQRLGRAEINSQTMSKCLGAPIGCLRASIGIPTNEQDVDTLILFVRDFALSQT